MRRDAETHQALRQRHMADLLQAGADPRTAVARVMHECSVSKRTAQRDLGAIRAQFQAETKDIAAERFGKQLEDIAIIRATCRRRIDIDGKGCPGYMAQLIAAGGREARLLGLDKPEKYSLVVDFQIVIPGAEEAPVEEAEDDG